MLCFDVVTMNTRSLAFYTEIKLNYWITSAIQNNGLVCNFCVMFSVKMCVTTLFKDRKAEKVYKLQRQNYMKKMNTSINIHVYLILHKDRPKR